MYVASACGVLEPELLLLMESAGRCGALFLSDKAVGTEEQEERG